jgi:hypothetical protein
MNMLREAMTTLRDWRDEFMSEDIEYIGADGTVALRARVGFSTATELDDLGDGATEVRSTDFVFAAGQVTPRLGDIIAWQGRRYRLSSKSGSPCWRNADNHGVSIRVSTKEEGMQ